MSERREAPFLKVLVHYGNAIVAAPFRFFGIAAAVSVPTLLAPEWDALRQVDPLGRFLGWYGYRPTMLVGAAVICVYQFMRDGYLQHMDSVERARRDQATIASLNAQLDEKGSSVLERTLVTLHAYVLTDTIRADNLYARVCDQLATGIVDSDFNTMMAAFVGADNINPLRKPTLQGLFEQLELMKRDDHPRRAVFIRNRMGNEVCLELKRRGIT